MITGATGTIGQHLLKSDFIKNYDCICLVRSVLEVEPIKSEAYITFHSIEDADEVVNKADAILHLASLTRSSSEKKLKKNNETLTEFCVGLANTNNIPQFIFLSTNLATAPCGPYGISKRNCEDIIQSQYHGTYTIVRCPSIEVNSPPANNSSMFQIKSKIRDGKLIFLPEKGMFKLSVLNIEELISFLASVISSPPKRSFLKDFKGKEIVLHDELYAFALQNLAPLKIIGIPFKLVIQIISLLERFGFRLAVFEVLKHLRSNQS